MKKFLLIIMSCIFSVALTAMFGFAQDGSGISGKKLYKNKCQFCHGIRGDGKGPAAESLLGHPVDFTDTEFWQEDVVKKIDVTIKNGKEMMPAFDLEPNEIQAITIYITQTFKKPNQKNK